MPPSGAVQRPCHGPASSACSVSATPWAATVAGMTPRPNRKIDTKNNRKNLIAAPPARSSFVTTEVSANAAAQRIEPAPNPLAARRVRLAAGRSAKFGQDGVEIFIALAIEELLVGAKRRHAAFHLFAKLAPGNRPRAGHRHNHDRSFGLFDFIDRNEFN